MNHKKLSIAYHIVCIVRLQKTCAQIMMFDLVCNGFIYLRPLCRLVNNFRYFISNKHYFALANPELDVALMNLTLSIHL